MEKILNYLTALATTLKLDVEDVVVALKHKDGNDYFMIPWQVSGAVNIDELNSLLQSVNWYAKLGDVQLTDFNKCKAEGVEYTPSIFINKSNRRNALEVMRKAFAKKQ
tara:strand:+ start:7132 stop:7455 length:324 start_codon:yes stop_codon:yes gene_type:complete